MNNITVTRGEKKAIWTIYGAYLQSRCRLCYTEEILRFQVSQTKKLHKISPSRKTDAFFFQGYQSDIRPGRSIRTVFQEFQLCKIISK